MGGFLGTIMLGTHTELHIDTHANPYTGALASESVNGVGASWELFGKQLAAACGCAVYSFVVTYAQLWLINKISTVRPTDMEDVDFTMHNEHAYQNSSTRKTGVTPHTYPCL
jgi:Amt family ammonium transporter